VTAPKAYTLLLFCATPFSEFRGGSFPDQPFSLIVSKFPKCCFFPKALFTFAIRKSGDLIIQVTENTKRERQ